MAGDRQSVSGTSFDPSPQFWVYQIEHGQLAAVTGRCLFAPVTAGMRFDTVAVKHADQWQGSPCCLHVEEIRIFRRLIDELDQGYSARLVLSGRLPPSLAPESVLVAQDCPSAGDWIHQGQLWTRRLR